MSTVSMVIYGLAAAWAVQSLLSLIVERRQTSLLRLKHEELARRAAQTEHQKQHDERLPGKARPQRSAQPTSAAAS